MQNRFRFAFYILHRSGDIATHTRIMCREEAVMARSDRQNSPETERSGAVQALPVPALPDPARVEPVRRLTSAIPAWLSKLFMMVLGLFVFILALQLLKQGAKVYGGEIIRFLNVRSTANSLGFGWLLAYIFLSGSPVAAIAVSFFSAGTITNLQAFTMITGSRLGASFIVLFVGFIYYMRGHQRSASVSIGVLALLTTAAIYLPALALGYWMLTSGGIGTIHASADTPVASFIDKVYGPILDLIKQAGLPGWLVVLLGIGSLLLAFNLLDKALPEMNPERSAFQRIGRLVYRPMAMFILGCAVTSVTLSVSVSLSILVPLSAKGLVRRENTLPYIMGANITTFIDTLVAALINGGPAAFTIVLVEMISVTILSLLVLALCYRPFERGILRLQELIIRDNRTLGAFLCIMLVVPLILLLVK
jgi:solute carrier family 34 (sodium-dependent phosphate cotransporter)